MVLGKPGAAKAGLVGQPGLLHGVAQDLVRGFVLVALLHQHENSEIHGVSPVGLRACDDGRSG
jgi:hypothetical protein